ncbi:hypothetical protein LEMLEM_LOCUS3852 [Lemmus lemmus]
MCRKEQRGLHFDLHRKSQAFPAFHTTALSLNMSLSRRAFLVPWFGKGNRGTKREKRTCNMTDE